MKSTWTEPYAISMADLMADVQSDHPDWDEAQVAAEAQRWAAIQDHLDHEDYKQDRNFYHWQEPCQHPHLPDLEADSDPGDEP